MPIYDYACTSCGRVTEVIHGINDSGPKFCPNCGAGGTMKKALSAPAVVFKGSGWAKVDRRSSSTGSTGTKASKAKASDSSSGDAHQADGAASKAGGATGGEGGAAGATSTSPSKADS